MSQQTNLDVLTADMLSRLIDRSLRPEEDYIIAAVSFEEDMASILKLMGNQPLHQDSPLTIFLDEYGFRQMPTTEPRIEGQIPAGAEVPIYEVPSLPVPELVRRIPEQDELRNEPANIEPRANPETPERPRQFLRLPFKLFEEERSATDNAAAWNQTESICCLGEKMDCIGTSQNSRLLLQQSNLELTLFRKIQ